MAKEKVLLRKRDGSGSGYLFSADDAKKFLKANPNYVEETPEETQANQRAADEAVQAAAAAEADEKKSAKPAKSGESKG